MKEFWKPIPGYEGIYEVSSTGMVKSLPRSSSGKVSVKTERTLSSVDDGKGYRTIKLCKNGKIRRFFIHRLVALAFIQNPENLPFVNHKDENPSNNNVDNLEWCTQRYNVNYGNSLIKMREAAIKSEGRSICCYDLQGNLVKEYACFIDAVRDGHKRRHIEECIKGEKLTHHGLYWSNKGEKPITRNPIAGKAIPIIGYPVGGGEPICYNSMIDAQKDGFYGQNISHCVNGKQKTHKGYKWYKRIKNFQL